MAHTHHPHDLSHYNRSFAAGVFLNTVFVLVEAGFGVFSDSLALIADAGHNLSDVVSLLLAWGAVALASKSATEKRTYGFGKITVIASLVSAIILFVALGGIAWEAVGRIADPQPVRGMTVIVVAAVGVVINSLTAMLFYRGQQHDLNIRGAFLHMAADAAVSLGVVVSGVFILLKGWLWIDPLVTLFIVMTIFKSSWGLFRDSMNYAIDAVPESIDMTGIKRYLTGLDGVEKYHDLHVWPLSTTDVALTVHLVVDHDCLDNRFLRDIQQHLHDHFGIAHATIQVESAEGAAVCMLDRQD